MVNQQVFEKIKEHIEKDGTGRIWIKKRRVKTGVLSRIPLLPIAKIILDKYKGGDKLLPIQDPADINKYLKDIAKRLDITYVLQRKKV